VTYRIRRKARRKATACVEFAVLLPVLLALFLFATDFARVLYYSITIENCALDGALFGSQAFDNQNQQWIGNQQYWQGPSGQIVSQEKAVAELDGSNLNPALADSNVTVSTGTDANGNTVNIVTVTYTFNTIVPYPGIPSPLTIVRRAQARVAPPTPK
jgi:Flp pilus assembly protein TadG